MQRNNNVPYMFSILYTTNPPEHCYRYTNIILACNRFLNNRMSEYVYPFNSIDFTLSTQTSLRTNLRNFVSTEYDNQYTVTIYLDKII